MENIKHITTPLSAYLKLLKSLEPITNVDINYMKMVPYSSAIGNIMHAMVCTRPDLAHGVEVVSRFMGNPSKDHWNGVKWILRYLRGTAENCNLFRKVNKASLEISGFVDSDFVEDLDRRISKTVFVFTVCGGAIS